MPLKPWTFTFDHVAPAVLDHLEARRIVAVPYPYGIDMHACIPK